MKKTLGINAVLNAIKSSLSILFPLITYPYVLRILGAENIGKVSFTSSIISYFAMIAALGVTQYSVREGARLHDDKLQLSKFANEVFSINVISTAVSMSLLALVTILNSKLFEYRYLLLIQSAAILFTTFGIEWVNNLFEDYIFITLRSIASYTVGLILIFLFIKDTNDYYKYAAIQLVPVLFVFLFNRRYCRKYVELHFSSFLNLGKHLKPLVVFFANNIAVLIYVNIDTTMCGWILGDYQVGLYTASVKIYTIIKNLLAAVYTVTIPRLSFYATKDDLTEYRQLLSEIWHGIIIILLPISVGIVAFSQEIIWIVGGKEFTNASISLSILGFALIFALFGGLTTICINVTLRREKENLIATIISAIMNALLNLFFIPHFGINGAAFTTLLSEMFVFAFCFIRIKDKNTYFNNKTIKQGFFLGVLGIIIVIVVRLFLASFIESRFYLVFFSILSVGILYIITLIFLKDVLLMRIIAKANRTKKLK